MKKLIGVAMVVAAAAALFAQVKPSILEWPTHGNDTGESKYSPAVEINTSNVSQLEIAWQWDPKEEPLADGTRPGNFEGTPLMINDVLYLPTSYNRVVALNAETGAQLWAFDPKAYLDGPGINLYYNHRGVAAWRNGSDLRIFMNSHYRLFSVDAKTGKLITTFGRDGYVDLTEGIRSPIKKSEMRQTSPPVVYKNLVIVGSSIPDHLNYKGDPTGTVSAYDVQTGKRAWTFYTIPQPGEFGNETWENDSWAYTGHANVWGTMSLDENRGLLYLPVSTPSSDYYGGRRPGANLFAETLVCLDASTGKRKWHFQAVHHGLWDYDFTAPPNLITINVDGRRIDAVAEVSKQGFTYVFDRVSGKPVWPIEERPVDTTTNVPGEKPYPTQPFPTKPPAFSAQGVSLADANDLTPEIHELAVAEMKKYRLGPLFTPPSLEGTLQRPTGGGGANWGGAAFDPETGRLYVKTTDTTNPIQICQNDFKESKIDTDYRFYCEEMESPTASGGRGVGTPAPRVRGLGGVPLTKPPYASLVAIDLNKGEIAWKVPNGEGGGLVRSSPLLRGVSLPARLGSGTAPGPLVTKGGLVFAGAGESYLYVYDKVSGREITRLATPYRPSGNPISYRTRSGKQLVLVATGAGPDASLVAFGLPSSPAAR